jgi:hypothetical protein
MIGWGTVGFFAGGGSDFDPTSAKQTASNPRF